MPLPFPPPRLHAGVRRSRPPPVRPPAPARVSPPFSNRSTSEIYGDPEVHPQQESYWGHVNCIGPRACYDEGKRISETLCYEYHKLGVSVRIARIFNTCVFFLRGRALLFWHPLPLCPPLT